MEYKVGTRVKFYRTENNRRVELIGTIVEKKKHGRYGIARFGSEQFADWVKVEDVIEKV